MTMHAPIQVLFLLAVLFRTSVCIELDADGMRWSQSQIDADSLSNTNTNLYGNAGEHTSHLIYYILKRLEEAIPQGGWGDIDMALSASL